MPSNTPGSVRHPSRCSSARSGVAPAKPSSLLFPRAVALGGHLPRCFRDVLLLVFLDLELHRMLKLNPPMPRGALTKIRMASAPAARLLARMRGSRMQRIQLSRESFDVGDRLAISCPPPRSFHHVRSRPHGRCRALDNKKTLVEIADMADRVP